MLDELRAMAVFASVARRGSLAAAARELNVTRAAVSHQIRGLEARLGVPLTQRSTRHMSLTPAGEAFAERCQRMVDEASAGLAGVDLARREPRGKVRLTCSHHFGQRRIVPALIEFRRRHPDIEIDLLFTDANLDIVARGVDLAVRAGPLQESSLRARRLLRDETFLCAAPSYLARHGAPRDVDDLARHRWVIYPRTLSRVTLGEGDGARRIEVSGKVRTNSGASRLTFVLEGEGLARLPGYDARPALAAGRLVHLLPGVATAPIEIFLVHGTSLGPSARLLADHLLASMLPERGR